MQDAIVCRVALCGRQVTAMFLQLDPSRQRLAAKERLLGLDPVADDAASEAAHIETSSQPYKSMLTTGPQAVSRPQLRCAYQASEPVWAAAQALAPDRAALAELQAAHGIEAPLEIDLSLAGVVVCCHSLYCVFHAIYVCEAVVRLCHRWLVEARAEGAPGVCLYAPATEPQASRVHPKHMIACGQGWWRRGWRAWNGRRHGASCHAAANPRCVMIAQYITSSSTVFHEAFSVCRAGGGMGGGRGMAGGDR